MERPRSSFSAERRSSDDAGDTLKTTWQKRRSIRESLHGKVNVWNYSPPEPASLSERFKIGSEARRRRERKRQRKEERRRRKEAKRARIRSLQTKERKDTLAEEKATVEKRKTLEDSSSEEEIPIGPKPPIPVSRNVGSRKNLDYGKALRPGEASKMAAYVQDGVRIPRRGEIGLTGEQIESYEAQGYVMSGSRNRRMEAVRIRKENQVYSAEELAALNNFSHEERKVREERVMNQFQKLVDSKFGKDGKAETRKEGEGDN